MKKIISFITICMWSSAAVAQITADFKKEAFEEQLQLYLGAKAEGIEVSSEFASAVSDDVKGAINAMAAATEYIAQSFCPEPARPTKITLHLTAGFKLVFEAQAGSSVEWELDTVCDRLNQQ